MFNSQLDDLTRAALRLFESDEDHYPIYIKEILQINALDAMVEAGLFEDGLVFKGGTVSRLCYRSPRHSEDLDFSMPKQLTATNLDELERLLRHLLRNQHRVDVEFQRNLDQDSVRPTGISHWRARIALPIPLRPDVIQKHLVRVDIAHMPTMRPVRLLPAISDLMPARQPLVAAMDPEELLLEKCVALIEREQLKWRDVFDIWYLEVRGTALRSEWYVRKLQHHRLSIDQARKRLLERRNQMAEAHAPTMYAQELARFLKGSASHSESTAQHVIQRVLNLTDSLLEP